MSLLGADLEPGEAGDGDTRILDHLADAQLVVLGVILLEQCDLLEVRTETTLDDLRQRGLGLALVARDLLDDASLVLDGLGGDVLTGEVLRVGEGDVLRDAASGLRVVTGVTENDTDLRGQVFGGLVQVDREVLAGDDGDAAELDLLAEDRRLVADELGDGLAAGGGREGLV